jgi:hypothetical protein
MRVDRLSRAAGCDALPLLGVKGSYRLTRLRVGLIVLLAAALVSVFFGSRNAQIGGFAVAMLILCLGAMRLLWDPGPPPSARRKARQRSEGSASQSAPAAAGANRTKRKHR